MKNRLLALLFAVLMLLGALCGCAGQAQDDSPAILATTAPLYELTARLLEGTKLSCGRLVTESVSCLHEYTLSVNQMKLLEQADVVVTNGLGLEDFMADALRTAKDVICASEGADTLPGEDGADPHLWLSPMRCIGMCSVLARELSARYPDDAETIEKNRAVLEASFLDVQAYGERTLAELSCRELVTFHDGFSYLADAFGLTVAAAMEIESGSEPSARELADVIALVQERGIPAVFDEANGAAAVSETVAAATGAEVFTLDLGMGAERADLAQTIRKNIDTIKEALG